MDSKIYHRQRKQKPELNKKRYTNSSSLTNLCHESGLGAVMKCTCYSGEDLLPPWSTVDFSELSL